MKTRLYFLSIALLFAVLASLLGVPAHPVRAAAAISVDTLADNMDNDGLCTLREAITAANANAPVNGADDCNHDDSTGTDTITIEVYGTILLTSNLPELTSNMEIDGGETSINGDKQFRPFYIAPGTTVKLTWMRIDNGAAVPAYGSGFKGAGIYNDGTLTLENLWLNNNYSVEGGGAIYNNGSMSIHDTYFQGNNTWMDGGAIDNDGSFMVFSSVFDNNMTALGNGAAIHNNGVMINVHETYFFGNSSGGEGGAVSNDFDGSGTMYSNAFWDNTALGVGGAVHNRGSLTIGDSTFYANQADFPGGGVYNSGALTMYGNTIAGNSASDGGGLYNSVTGELDFYNTIIASSISGGDCTTLGSIGNNDHNLTQDGSCGALYSGDPMLETFADNGGATKTMALLPASPMINAGSNLHCSATDQRGVNRPQGSGCDIGAFELDTPAVDLSASALDFGYEGVGYTSTPQNVTLTNTGPVNLAIGSLGITGDFDLVNDTCTGADLAPEAICSFEVTFSPLAAGPAAGEVTIPSNAPSDPDIVSLSGIGVVPNTANFMSVAVYDGQLLESQEASNVGTTPNSNGAYIGVGDSSINQQSMGLLHFDTASLPVNAVVIGVTIRVKQYQILGTNPFTTHGNLNVDIAAPYFGSEADLKASDFQAASSMDTAGFFNPVLLGENWYEAILSQASFPHLNTAGTTQFRLRFALDDNNDKGNDLLLFFSGNFANASYRPVLIVEYYVP